MDFSIVIPTYNRAELVEALLASLLEERRSYSEGETEVLIVDSSAGEQKKRINDACIRYDATYVEWEDNVRKKRNKGILLSRFDTIIFIDSDVVVQKGLLSEYRAAYMKQYPCKLGGILGYTMFTGKRTFWWRMLERTSMVDSFAFARNYPFHSWTICNNVSFRKAVLLEIGMFEENFPFKLGGDDLDLSYRVTKAGYLIASAPNAVTLHSRKTWNNYAAIHDRAKRWGTMENYIVERHPELYKRVIPKNWLIKLAVIVFLGLLSLALWSLIPLTIAGVWLLLTWMTAYVQEMITKGACSPLCFFGAKLIQLQYEFYRLKGSFHKHSPEALYKGIVFNRYQIRGSMKGESARMWTLMITFAVAAAAVLLFVRLTGIRW